MPFWATPYFFSFSAKCVERAVSAYCLRFLPAHSLLAAAWPLFMLCWERIPAGHGCAAHSRSFPSGLPVAPTCTSPSSFPSFPTGCSHYKSHTCDENQCFLRKFYFGKMCIYTIFCYYQSKVTLLAREEKCIMYSSFFRVFIFILHLNSNFLICFYF